MSEESTTPEPIKLVRQPLGTSNRHNLDAIMSFFAPRAVWDRSASELQEDRAFGLRVASR
jgi:hypothetical protein